MRVIGAKKLSDFAQKEARAKAGIEAWVAEAREAKWASPVDIKDSFAHVSIIKGHYVFNIGGNKYRLDTRINFATGTVLVVRIGTHKQYDAWKFA